MFTLIKFSIQNKHVVGKHLGESFGHDETSVLYSNFLSDVFKTCCLACKIMLVLTLSCKPVVLKVERLKLM